MHGLGWIVVWTIPVFAQTAPEAGELPPADATAEAPVPPPRAVPRKDTHAWYDAVPTDAPTRVFMALSAVGDRALVVDGGGGVWRTEDGGGRWRLVMRPLVEVRGPDDLTPLKLDRDSGDTLLDYRAQDLTEELDDYDAEFDDFDGYGDAEIAESDADSDPDTESEAAEEEVDAGDAGDLQEDIAQQILLEGLLADAQEAGLREGAMRLGGVAFLHPDLPDLALVGRADGIWRSIDGGSDWSLVDPMGTATVFAAGPGPLLYAGGADGLRYSVDQGRTWIDKDDPMDGQRVKDLVVGEDGVWWCGTDQGLYRSEDSEYWDRVPAQGMRSPGVFALLPEPGAPGSLLIADNETLYRSLDSGLTALVLGRQPLLDTTRLLPLEAPGHLLASGSDGVWETVDGGLTWHPLYQGLKDPQVFDIAMVGEQLYAVTLSGLLRLVEGRPEPEPGRESSSQWRPSGGLAPSLSEVVWVSTTRHGLDPLIYSQRRLRRTLLLPQVELSGRCDFDNRVATTIGSHSTLAVDRDCMALIELDWNRGTSLADQEVVVIDGAVYVDTGSIGIPVAAASTARHMTDYRYAVIGLLTELYLSREQLLDAYDHIPPDDLRAQVLHVLQIQEVTARLDSYTDGAFSRGIVPTE